MPVSGRADDNAPSPSASPASIRHTSPPEAVEVHIDVSAMSPETAADLIAERLLTASIPD